MQNNAASGRLQNVRYRRTLTHMKVVALLSVVLSAGEASAARSAVMHIGVEVVSSAHLVATTSSRAVAFESRAFGSRAPAVLVEQRSGSPVRLRDGSPVPREGKAAIVLSGGRDQRLAFLPSRGNAELVVTLFPDGAPPRVRN
jgi:hypothetical protein